MKGQILILKILSRAHSTENIGLPIASATKSVLRCSNEGCDKRTTLSNIVMMAFGWMERTESQWEKLPAEVGLKIRRW